jgi:hypothetical protein
VLGFARINCVSEWLEIFPISVPALAHAAIGGNREAYCVQSSCCWLSNGQRSPTITSQTGKFTIGFLSVLILGLAAACGSNHLGSSQETKVDSGTSRTDGSAEAAETLENLAVASPGSMSGYSRERFPH